MGGKERFEERVIKYVRYEVRVLWSVVGTYIVLDKEGRHSGKKRKRLTDLVKVGTSGSNIHWKDNET